MVDRTIIDLFLNILTGTGALAVVFFTQYQPKITRTYLGPNLFKEKRAIIKKIMTTIFAGLTLVGVMIQTFLLVYGLGLTERTYDSNWYLWFAVLDIMLTASFAAFLIYIGKKIARRYWLPRSVAGWREAFEEAKEAIEHDGLLMEQFLIREKIIDTKKLKEENYIDAQKKLDEIIELLEIPNCKNQSLEGQIKRINTYFN